MSTTSPGRPGITYEQVAAAANRLLGSGARPTSRAVRDHLGEGSLATVQRHLREWTSRRRERAASPFDIGPEDVEALSPSDFVMLLNHLIRAEALQNGLDATMRTTRRITVADGGVDGTIQWQDGRERTPHLPARQSVWQAKSGRGMSASGSFARSSGAIGVT